MFLLSKRQRVDAVRERHRYRGRVLQELTFQSLRVQFNGAAAADTRLPLKCIGLSVPLCEIIGISRTGGEERSRGNGLAGTHVVHVARSSDTFRENTDARCLCVHSESPRLSQLHRDALRGLCFERVVHLHVARLVERRYQRWAERSARQREADGVLEESSRRRLRGLCTYDRNSGWDYKRGARRREDESDDETDQSLKVTWARERERDRERVCV